MLNRAWQEATVSALRVALVLFVGTFASSGCVTRRIIDEAFKPGTVEVECSDPCQEVRFVRLFRAPRGSVGLEATLGYGRAGLARMGAGEPGTLVEGAAPLPAAHRVEGVLVVPAEAPGREAPCLPLGALVHPTSPEGELGGWRQISLDEATTAPLVYAARSKLTVFVPPAGGRTVDQAAKRADLGADERFEFSGPDSRSRVETRPGGVSPAIIVLAMVPFTFVLDATGEILYWTGKGLFYALWIPVFMLSGGK